MQIDQIVIRNCMLWQSLEFPQGNTGSMFGYADAVSALKPWGCVGQRKPKYLFYVLGYVRGHLLLYSCVLDKDLDNHACNFSSPVDYLICTDVLLNIGNFLKHTSQIYDYLKSNPPPPLPWLSQLTSTGDSFHKLTTLPQEQ